MSEIPKLRVGDWGTLLTFQFNDSWCTPSDISAASSLNIKIIRPDDSYFERPLALVTNGTDGKASYILQQGDIPIPGQYQTQGFVITQSGAWSTTVVEFNVVATL